jgi:hypothetical protein
MQHLYQDLGSLASGILRRKLYVLVVLPSVRHLFNPIFARRDFVQYVKPRAA